MYRKMLLLKVFKLFLCLSSVKNVFSFTPKLVSSILPSTPSRQASSLTPSTYVYEQTSRTTRTDLSLVDQSTIEYFNSNTLNDLGNSANLLSTDVMTILSNENISKAFNVATFGPQILWLFMILLPTADITKKLMGTQIPIILFSLVHLFIVIASASQEDGTAPLVEFNDVFDPSGNPQAAMINMMRYPNFVSEEWSHVLTWDLFVGRIIWLDGLERGIFTSHSVLFCNLIGPPGYLLHVLTCLITGKGFRGSDVPLDED